jgi:hypothetical protein
MKAVALPSGTLRAQPRLRLQPTAWLASAALLFVALGAGCEMVGQYQSVSGRYPLTAYQADLVMQRALLEAWSANFPVHPLPHDRLGYKFEVWFGSEADTMVVEAERDGGGYVFRVSHDLSAPYEGVAARGRILLLLAKHARAIEASGEGKNTDPDPTVIGARPGP